LPIALELAQTPPVYAYQQSIEGRVVFTREPGDGTTDYPEPLVHPGVLTLRLHGPGGLIEDKSPVSSGPARAPPARILHSKRPREEVGLAFASPSKPGEWVTELEVRIGERTLRAPEVRFTVRPALAAVAVATFGQPPVVLSKVFQVSGDGVLLSHSVVSLGLGEFLLTEGKQLDALEPGPHSLLAASALPEVSNSGIDLVLPAGEGAAESAQVRRYHPSGNTVASVTLRTGKEPAPLWLEPPVQTRSEGRLVLGWAVGDRLRVAIVDGTGKVTGPLEVALPGPIRRGIAVGQKEGSVQLLLDVEQAPEPIPPGKLVPRIGSTDDLPDPTSGREQLIFPKGLPPRTSAPPPHRRYLYGLAVPDGPLQALPAPRRLASLPARTIGMTAWPAGREIGPALWVIEGGPGAPGAPLVEATRVDLLPAPAGPALGQPERRRLRTGLPDSTAELPPIAALECQKQRELRVVFRLKAGLLWTNTEEGSLGDPRVTPLDPMPDFLGFASGRLLLHDPRTGLTLR
jgi:hypothetical protein